MIDGILWLFENRGYIGISWYNSSSALQNLVPNKHAG